MQPSVHPAITYFLALYDPEETVCITLLSATKTFKNGQPLTVNRFVPMAKVIAPAGIARLTKLNKENHIFCAMCSFVPGSKNRVKSNIERVANCFIEADERGPEILAAVRASVAAKEIPPPSIIVESSPNKYQFIWSVENFEIATQVAMNKTLATKFGTDMASTDCARVLRAPGFFNIKPAYNPKPIARIVEYNKHFLRYGPEDFKIEMTVKPDTTVHVAADDSDVEHAIQVLLAGLEAANIGHSGVQPWTDAFRITLTECPWADAHENGQRGDAMVAIQASAKPMFKCLHRHCAERNWIKDFRPYLEKRAGKRLKFGKKPVAA
jgi:hypothetical protein